jgi:quinoprotein glucose dehydrogenase
VANTSPPAIVGNVLVASMSLHTGSTPNLPGASINEQWPMNIPGDVVGYDTKTGKMLWRFNIIPRPEKRVRKAGSQPRPTPGTCREA